MTGPLNTVPEPTGSHSLDDLGRCQHMVRIFCLLFAMALLSSLLVGSGCRRSLQGSPPDTLLTKAQVRELAIRYRDEYVAKNHPEDSSFLARGIIQTVERTSDGWHVIFVTETGHDSTTPEGMHDYYLHVFLKASGELDRIERGPDVLS